MADGDRQSLAHLFELELPLPDERLDRLAKRLVGFEQRYEGLRQDLRVLVDLAGLETWSKRFYSRRVPLIDAAADRYPLVIFHGDVGTGKTATAEAASSRLARDLGREAVLFKLSTRVRGSGNVGQMSMLINSAFDVVAKEAGKSRVSFLIIDEGDSIATSRSEEQSHHEDKVAVNTLIQKIDDVRRFDGRVLVYICTNRAEALDPAILRRAARQERFDRPDDAEREALLRADCDGLGLSDDHIRDLVRLTGPIDGRDGFTFSDLRTRLVPGALARAYPKRAVRIDDLLESARSLEPTPPMGGGSRHSPRHRMREMRDEDRGASGSNRRKC